jgi:hypothetical protein
VTENDRAGREDFLARWSQRKRAVQEAEAAEETAAAEEAAAAADEAADEEALAANRAAAEAIDLDSLKPGFDMSPFYKAGVPAALKQAALRKLWRSDPLFALQDGLDVYRENFNDPSYLLKGRASSWMPGSGYAKRFEELKEQAKAALARAEEEARQAGPAEVADGADAAPGREADGTPAAEAQAAAQHGEAPEEGPGEDEATEEAEPAPRVPLRSRLDFAAFKDEG